MPFHMSFFTLFQLHLPTLEPWWLWARALFLAERKPSWHREATTPNRQHRKDLEDTDKTDEQKMGNLDTEDEDLLLISPEAGLLSSRSSNLPRLDSILMEHHHVPLPSLTRPHPTHF